MFLSYFVAISNLEKISCEALKDKFQCIEIYALNEKSSFRVFPGVGVLPGLLTKISVFSCVNGYFSIWEDLEYGGFYLKFMSKFLVINPRHSGVWHNVWMKVSS